MLRAIGSPKGECYPKEEGYKVNAALQQWRIEIVIIKGALTGSGSSKTHALFIGKDSIEEMHPQGCISFFGQWEK
jgi:hypothetical protein